MPKFGGLVLWNPPETMALGILLLNCLGSLGGMQDIVHMNIELSNRDKKSLMFVFWKRGIV